MSDSFKSKKQIEKQLKRQSNINNRNKNELNTIREFSGSSLILLIVFAIALGLIVPLVIYSTDGLFYFNTSQADNIPIASQASENINITKADLYFTKDYIDSFSDLDNLSDYYVHTFNDPYQIDPQYITIPRGYKFSAISLYNDTSQSIEISDTETVVSYDKPNVTESIQTQFYETYNVSVPYNISVEVNGTETITEFFYNFTQALNDSLICNTTVTYTSFSLNASSSIVSKGSVYSGDYTDTYTNDSISHIINSTTVGRFDDISVEYIFEIPSEFFNYNPFMVQNLSIYQNAYVTEIPDQTHEIESEGNPSDFTSDFTYTYPQTVELPMPNDSCYFDVTNNGYVIDYEFRDNQDTLDYTLYVDEVHITGAYLDEITTCYLNGTVVTLFNDTLNTVTEDIFNIELNGIAEDTLTINETINIDIENSTTNVNDNLDTLLNIEENGISVENDLTIEIIYGNSVFNFSLFVYANITNEIVFRSISITLIFNETDNLELQFVPLELTLGDVNFDEIEVNSEVEFNVWRRLTNLIVIMNPISLKKLFLKI